MANVFTAANLQKLLRKKWKEAGCTLGRKQRPGVSTGALSKLSASRNSKLRDPHFALWIAIYDEFVSWLISLISIVQFNSRRRPYTPTDYEKAVVLLLMRIVADSLAIRHLMLLGFDAAARTQVRTTSEHVELLIAILDDPAMGAEFCKTRDEVAANKFWKAYLSKHKIRPRIKDVWLKFFRGDHAPAKWFANWGSNGYSELSAIAHPSFMGCVHAVLPAKAEYTDENWLGLWGDRSLSSIGTIETYLSFLFPLVLALRDFPFGKKTRHFRRPCRYNATNEFHRHVKYGRDVLTSLVLSLNNEGSHQYIYPFVPPFNETPHDEA